MFKLIPNYENYSVDENGAVMNNRSNKIIHQHIDSMGYYKVFLFKNNKAYERRVHQLVAHAFLNHKSTWEKCINHKDGNKLNNKISNLEMVSQVENLKHSHKLGLHKNAIEAMRYSHWKTIKD